MLYVVSCENVTWVNVVLGHRFLVTRWNTNFQSLPK